MTMQPTIECVICVEEYTELKVLPCNSEHAFCVKCLERCIEDSDFVNKISCPLCRRKCRFKEKGVRDLPNKKPSSARVIPIYSCDMCNKMGEKLEATGFCMDCNEQLCKRCYKYHNLQKHLKSHQIVDIKFKYVAKGNSNYCKEHPDQQNQIYCYDCKSIVCTRCHLNKHKEHKCCHIDECAEEFRQQLNAQINNIRRNISETKDILKILENDKKSFLENVTEVEKTLLKIVMKSEDK